MLSYQLYPHRSYFVDQTWVPSSSTLMKQKSSLQSLISISTPKSCNGQKRPLSEAEVPIPWVSIFQRLAPTASKIQDVPITTKSSKKATHLKPWASKYTQKPLGVHLKDTKDFKKTAPSNLSVTKQVQGVRKVQIIN